MRQTFKNFLILFLLLAGGELFSQSIGMRIPDTTGVEGTYIDIPVYADSSFTDKGVFSYVLGITYNSNYLRADSVITEGAIAGSFGSATANLDDPGFIGITGAGSSTLTGSGAFIYIRFELLQPGTMYIGFTASNEYNYFNEGNPLMEYINGSVNITPAPKITIGPNSSLLQSGEQLQMYVRGDTLSPFTWEVVDTAVASIDESGLLTATGPGINKVSVTDSNGLTDITDGSIEVRGYRLSIPGNLEEWQGGTIDIPVNTTDLTGLGIVSGNFTVTYNQGLLELVEIITDTTLLDGIVPQYNLGNNAIDIAFAENTPITGEGALMYLRFDISSENTGATSLSFNDVLFNEDLLAMITNGYFSTINFANISISPNTATVIAGDSLQFSASNGILPYTWSSSDTSVAKIDSSGMLLGIHSGVIQVTAVDSAGATKTSGNITVIDTEVIVPDTTGPVNASFNLPVYINDLPEGRSVSSLEAEFSFRTPELEYVGIVTSGTLTEGWTFSESSSGNLINLAMAGANGFNQEGILFYISFNLTADLTLNEYAYVNINSLLLNERTPNARTDNGNIIGSKSEDLGASAIISPVTACELTGAESVTVSVYNYGYITYSAGDTIVVGYQLNSENSIKDTLILSAELPPASSVDFTFDSTVNMSAPGSYTLSAYTLLSNEFDGNTGNDKKTVQIEVYGDLAVSLGSDVIACEDDTVTLNAGTGFETYTWSNGSSSTEFLEVTASGEYSVIVTNSLGCQGTDTVLVTFNALPVVELGSDTSICDGSVVTLDAGSGFASYNWNRGVSSARELAVDTSGTYFVEVTDTYGCSSVSDTINITVLPLPEVDLGSDTALCAGSVLEISAGTGFSSYAWSTGDSTETISVDQSGTYIATVNNANGCSNSDTILVDFVQVDVNLGEDVILCEGSDYTIQAPNGDYLYEWSDNSTGSSITVSQTGTYSVTVTDIVTGCSSSDTIDVSFDSEITVDMGPDVYACGTDSVVLSAGNGFDTYNWEGTTNNTSELIVTESGTYVVTVTSGSNCSATDTVEVFYNPAPSLELGADIAACVGDSVLLVAPSGFSVYNWNNGLSDNDTLLVTEPGTYVLEVANEFGCTVKDSLNVAFDSIPDITISGDTVICGGSTVELIASGADTYTWNTGETTASIFVSPVEPMVYEVTGTVNACSATSSIAVHVNESYLIEENVAICAGDSVMWDGNYYSVAGTYEETYPSVSGCDSTTRLNLEVGTSFLTEEEVTICEGDSVMWDGAYLYPEAGTYQYELSLTSLSGCDSTVRLTLNVIPSYLFEENISICQGDSVQWQGNYYDTTGIYDMAYQPLFGCDSIYRLNLVVGEPSIDTLAYSLCGGDTLTWQGMVLTETGQYAYTTTSGTGCDSTIVLDLTVFEQPDTPVVAFSDSILTSSVPDGNQWYFNGTAIEGATEQTFKVIQEGDYFVIVTSADGCLSAPSDTLAVTFTNVTEFNNFNVNIYPNPATDVLFVENSSGMEMQFDIYDITGKKMMNTLIRGDFEEVDIIDLKPSLYFIKITIDGSTRVDKVIIE
ncbi:MAG: T9SS type A sorting domain-containing protein [Bacteroidales bacterium]|nr:T9SS type A sorting domain-containing protein [Bacteroidales bacterium]